MDDAKIVKMESGRGRRKREETEKHKKEQVCKVKEDRVQGK